MAKTKEKKDVYVQNPLSKGDLHTSKGKYELNSKLSQQDLKYLYEQGFSYIVVKVEQ